jgi:hypothetical protein
LLMAAQMSDFQWPGQVVVAGGGRWARVIARELVGLLPPHVPVMILTSTQVPTMKEWVARELAGSRPDGAPIVVRADMPSSDSALDFGIALVVNRPKDHFATATRLIKSGYDVLVEKPFTTDPTQARELVTLGRSTRKIVAAGLVFRHAPYFDEFCRRLPFSLSDADRFEFFWSDPGEELRYGEVKRVPTDISLILDVLPHVWSILDRVFGGTDRISMRPVPGQDRDSPIEILASIGKVTGRILLSRPAPERKRLLRIAAGPEVASLDFTANVALVKLGESAPVPLSGHPEFGGPLARMLRSFMVIAAAAQPGAKPANVDAGDAPLTAEKIIEHMDLVAAVEREFQDRKK